MTHIDAARRLGQAGGVRRYPRFFRTGIWSGILGGLCCVGSAIAVGFGVGGLSFFTTWMNRYQMYFIIASIALMAAWVIRLIRSSGGRSGFAAAARTIWRQTLTMAVVYAFTLAAAMAVAALVRGT